jgi:septal ring factor EnvC (AmiA/AmiB activator)
MMDSQETFAQLPPVIMAALQMMQQMSGQAPMPPEVKALVDVQMAETQRKATKDQTDAMLDVQRLQLDAAKAEKAENTKLVMNTEKNLTAERIKAAELDHDAANLQHEQIKTVLGAQQALQSQMGTDNV